ncbi:hypothetical protein D3C84_1210510 [compost metagenome]
MQERSGCKYRHDNQQTAFQLTAVKLDDETSAKQEEGEQEVSRVQIHIVGEGC